MIRRPPRSTRTDTPLSLHDALPISCEWSICVMTARTTRIRAPACRQRRRSEEHTSELQSLMRISYAVFCLKKKKKIKVHNEQQRTINTTHNQQREHNLHNITN